jgi:hypothetical protein
MELNDDILKRVTERVIKFGKKTDGFTWWTSVFDLWYVEKWKGRINFKDSGLFIIAYLRTKTNCYSQDRSK